MSSGRSVGIIAATIAGLVAVAVLVVLLADRRSPQDFAPGSPEAVIQTYLAAFDDRDLEGAYGQFSAAAQRQMTFARFEKGATQWRASQGGDVSTVVLVDRSEIDGSEATVFVIVETTYGNGLELNTSRTERDVRLELESGTWRISDPLVWLDPADYYSFN